jgi:hypothetical protein
MYGSKEDMSDIVERLATAKNLIELEKAAAGAIDEIERLRETCVDHVEIEQALTAEIEQLRIKHKELEIGWQRTYDHDVGLLKAEIERLRLALDRAERTTSLTAAASSVAGEAVRKMYAAEAEIERLTTLIADAALVADERLGELDAKDAEIERLRELLREAFGRDFAHGRLSDLTHWQVGWMQRVREALGDE